MGRLESTNVILVIFQKLKNSHLFHHIKSFRTSNLECQTAAVLHLRQQLQSMKRTINYGMQMKEKTLEEEKLLLMLEGFLVWGLLATWPEISKTGQKISLYQFTSFTLV